MYAVYEHDRVVDDDTGQRDQAEKGEETKERAEDEQSGDDPDQAERNGAQHDKGLAEGVELDNQQRQNDKAGQRQLGDDRAHGLAALLRLAAQLVAIALLPRFAVFFEPRDELVGDILRRKTAFGVAGHGQGAVQVAPFDLGELPLRHDLRHLSQRHVFARPLGVDIDALQLAHIDVLTAFVAQDNGETLVAFAESSRIEPRERGLQRKGDILVGQAGIPGLGLVDVNDDFFDLGPPIVADILRSGYFVEFLLDAVGEAEQFVGIRPCYPHGHVTAASATSQPRNSYFGIGKRAEAKVI